MTRKFLNQLTREILQLVRGEGYAIDRMTVAVLISVDEFNRLQPIPPINKRLRNLFAILFGRAENSTLSLHFSLGSPPSEQHRRVHQQLFEFVGVGIPPKLASEPTNIIIDEDHLIDLLDKIKKHIASKNILFDSVNVGLIFSTEEIQRHSPYPDRVAKYDEGSLVVDVGADHIMARYFQIPDFKDSEEDDIKP